MEPIFLILIALVLVFGIGVLLVSRARAGKDRPAPPARAGTVTVPPPQAPQDAEIADVLTADVDVAAPPEEIVRPRFRDRLAKAQAALAGAFTGVRSRSGITQESWDDLEE